MEKMLVEGGHKLNGKIRVSGAKNSAVALLPAAMLADSDGMIEGLPDISDVYILGGWREEIGGSVRSGGETAPIDPARVRPLPLPHRARTDPRPSAYFVGASTGN